MELAKSPLPSDQPARHRVGSFSKDYASHSGNHFEMSGDGKARVDLQDDLTTQRSSVTTSMDAPVAAGVAAPDRPTDTPRFIETDVWRRAKYYSCTRKALEHLEKSFDQPIGLREIAEIACMERTTFSKAFKHKTGVTFHEFIQQYRVSQAVAKMEASDCSITVIALSVGFSSLDRFEKVFKKIAGTTPSHYRIEILRKNGLMPDTK
jgi:transcriptional regulator GlxA family with amidase domain